jgi:hypothetical protein
MLNQFCQDFFISASPRRRPLVFRPFRSPMWIQFKHVDTRPVSFVSSFRRAADLSQVQGGPIKENRSYILCSYLFLGIFGIYLAQPPLNRSFFMFRRKKLFILIPTLLLIPLLLGMVPINMAHKLAQGGAFAQGSHGCGNKNCPANSLISHNHFDAAIVNGTSPDHELTYFQKALSTVPESIHANIHSISTPLRC